MFNTHNPTEVNLLRVLAYGEGIISRDQFLEISNKTMLSRYIKAGYLKQAPNAEKGIYQTTPKFQRDYRRQIDPQHQFSGSGSATHSGGLNFAIALIPGGAKLQTGQEIKREFDRFRKTGEYRRALSRIQAREYEALKDARAAIQEAKGAHDVAYANYQLNAAQARYDLANDERRACSSPDLSITLTREQLEDWRGNLGNYYLNKDGLSHRQMTLLHQTITRLQELEKTTDREITICLEIITGSYGPVEICQKENYVETTGANLVYLSA